MVFNAGAAIYIAGMADSVQQGIVMAEEAIDSGKAKKVLRELVELSCGA